MSAKENKNRCSICGQLTKIKRERNASNKSGYIHVKCRFMSILERVLAKNLSKRTKYKR